VEEDPLGQKEKGRKLDLRRLSRQPELSE